ncbi:MAG: hypothetical protein CMH57_06020 [Myxococcales bacterium]|nr:hypothetical protein [Myxococcales bacterium]
MNIKIYILRDELQSMLESIVPMTVNLDPDNERSERWIRLDEPRDLEFIEEKFISLTLAAELRWPVPLLSNTHRITSIDARLYPSIQNTEDGARLVLDLKLKKLDVALLPGFLDTLIVQRSNATLAEQRARVAWNYSQNLAVNLGLPEWFESAEDLDIVVSEGVLTIRPDAIIVDLIFGIQLDRFKASRAQSRFAQSARLVEAVIADEELRAAGGLVERGGEGGAPSDAPADDELPPTRLV